MTEAGLLLPLAIGLPLLGAVLAPLLPGRFAPGFAILVFLLGNLAAVAIELAVYRAGTALLQPIGGLLLRADGLAAAMLGASALVTGAVGLYARAEYGNSRSASGACCSASGPPWRWCCWAPTCSAWRSRWSC